jgi:hypothetical protein
MPRKTRRRSRTRTRRNTRGGGPRENAEEKIKTLRKKAQNAHRVLLARNTTNAGLKIHMKAQKEIREAQEEIAKLRAEFSIPEKPAFPFPSVRSTEPSEPQVSKWGLNYPGNAPQTVNYQGPEE